MNRDDFRAMASRNLPGKVTDADSDLSLARRLDAEGFSATVTIAVIDGILRPTNDETAALAFTISQALGAGSPDENWAEAERRLKAGETL